MKKITMYTKSHCPYCIKAKELLDSLEVAYDEIDAIEQPELRQQAIEKYNWHTVPLILVGDQLLGGYDDIAKLHEKNELLSKLS